MLRVRVIPCLDVARGRVVKGTRFVDLTDEGDPPELAERYAAEGADEIVFLDIDAAPDGRGTLLDVVQRTARRAFVPLTVGGGVRSVVEMRDVLRAGADKVSFNTAAVRDPDLIRRCARRFGSQAVVVAIDARRARRAGRPRRGLGGGGEGRPRADGLDARRLGSVAPSRSGAGELLVTSIDRDGTGAGFDTQLLSRDRDRVPGAGDRLRAALPAPADFVAAVRDGGASAVLAASIFHRRRYSIAAVKAAMAAAGIPVRLTAGGGGMSTVAAALPWRGRSRSGEPRAVGARRPGPGRRPGRRRWPCPDARLRERGGARGDARDGRGPLLLALAGPPLAQGRDERQRPPPAGPRPRLRRRRAPCHRRAGRPRVPPGHPELLRRRRRRRPATAAAGPRPRAQGFAWLETLWSTIADRAATRPPGRTRPGSRRGRRRAGPEGRRGGHGGAHGRQGRRGRRGRRAPTGRPLRAALAGEVADLLYHALVLLAERGLPPSAVIETLRGRHAG